MNAEQLARFIGSTQRDGECIVWMRGCFLPRGYGSFSMNGKSRLTHRVSYEHFVGPIPAGLTLDHVCRNRLCVNPMHLEPVPRGENVLRGLGLTAMNARKTHCKYGHEFTPENTISDVPGRRSCRVCKQRRWREANVRRKAARAARRAAV